MAENVFDLIVLGSGAGGLSAALVSALEGLSVLLVEKTGFIGGTTAWSGGMVWVPGNAALPGGDDLAQARLYLDQVAAPTAEIRPLRDAYLAQAASAVDYLRAKAGIKLQPVSRYPDYYPGLPGASTGLRVLEPAPFNAAKLGDDFKKIRPPLPEFTLFGGMMINRADIAYFRNPTRSFAAAKQVARLLGTHALQRLTSKRGTTLHLGNALAGSLYLAARENGVACRLNTSVTAISRAAGQGFVLHATCPSGPCTLTSRHAIILATGGFAHDPAWRARLLPAAARHSAAAPGATGDGLRLGLAQGGQLGGQLGTQSAPSQPAFWVPVSCFQRKDGSTGIFPHTVTDRAKPGFIVVGPNATRFANEALSYHEFTLAMLRHGIDEDSPAFLLCDKTALWRYGIGCIKPFTLSLGRHLRQRYLYRGASAAALARATGLPAAALETVLREYNRHAAHGQDPQFHRGGDIYQRHMGDADHQPNPCVAPLITPPFYAVRLYPGTLGTACGLLTTPHGQLLDAANQPIPGLYACGNDQHAPLAGAYPGPGITLGPALIFGYLAARHAARTARPLS